MNPFHVSATQHAPNYLPQYVAQHLGFFADEGLAFEGSAPPDWTQVLDDLDAGAADLVLGGIWVPMMYHGRGRDYIAVAALNSRNPKVLVMRQPAPGFTWRDLEGKIVLAPGAGGTAPYVHTVGLMRKAGVDMSRVRWVRDLSGPVMADLFFGGHGDALVTDAFNGARLEHEGKAAIVARHDVDGGLMPNSVYYTTRERLERNDDIWRFCRAMHRAYTWLHEHPAQDARSVLVAEWPESDIDLLIQTVDDVRARGIWEDIRIVPEGYEEWLRIQTEDGLVSTDAPFDQLVDPRPAQDAVSRLAAKS